MISLSVIRATSLSQTFRPIASVPCSLVFSSSFGILPTRRRALHNWSLGQKVPGEPPLHAVRNPQCSLSQLRLT